jgi:hypothetical protein
MDIMSNPIKKVREAYKKAERKFVGVTAGIIIEVIRRSDDDWGGAGGLVPIRKK